MGNKNKTIEVLNRKVNLKEFTNHYLGLLDNLEELVTNQASHDALTEIHNQVTILSKYKFQNELKGIKTTESELDSFFRPLKGEV